MTPSTYAHGPNWLIWAGHLRSNPSARGLELGTFQGASAEWALQNLFVGPASHYTCVDTFEGSVEHHLNGIDCTSNEKIAREKLSVFNNVTIWKGYSNKFLATTQDAYDFIYIDAAHDAMNVMRDAVLSFEVLKSGGVIVFDDYTWREMPRPIDCPKMAVDAFLSCYADHLEVLGKGYQVAIRKK